MTYQQLTARIGEAHRGGASLPGLSALPNFDLSALPSNVRAKDPVVVYEYPLREISAFGDGYSLLFAGYRDGGIEDLTDYRKDLSSSLVGQGPATHNETIFAWRYGTADYPLRSEVSEEEALEARFVASVRRCGADLLSSIVSRAHGGTIPVALEPRSMDTDLVRAIFRACRGSVPLPNDASAGIPFVDESGRVYWRRYDEANANGVVYLQPITPPVVISGDASAVAFEHSLTFEDCATFEDLISMRWFADLNICSETRELLDSQLSYLPRPTDD